MTAPIPPPSSRHRAATARRVLLLALLGGLAAVFLFADTAHEAVLRTGAVIERLEASHPTLALVAVVLFTALSAMLAFVSTAVIAPFMAATWGTPLAALLLWTGWLIGGAIAYLIGRHLGRPVVARLASPRLLARYEDYVSHRAPFGLVLLFQLALPSEVPGYLLGLVGYPFWRYLLSLALAELPYALATVFLGAGVLRRQVVLVVALGVATALLSTWTYHILHQRLSATLRS